MSREEPKPRDYRPEGELFASDTHEVMAVFGKHLAAQMAEGEADILEAFDAALVEHERRFLDIAPGDKLSALLSESIMAVMSPGQMRTLALDLDHDPHAVARRLLPNHHGNVVPLRVCASSGGHDQDERAES